MLILVVVLAMEEAEMLKTMLSDHLFTILYPTGSESGHLGPYQSMYYGRVFMKCVVPFHWIYSCASIGYIHVQQVPQYTKMMLCLIHCIIFMVIFMCSCAAVYKADALFKSLYYIHGFIHVQLCRSIQS